MPRNSLTVATVYIAALAVLSRGADLGRGRADEQEWQKRMVVLIGQRHAACREALTRLKADPPEFGINDPRLTAIRVVSELHCHEAIQKLVAMIDLRATTVVTTEGLPNTGDLYPAAGALARIGKASARDCLWELGKGQLGNDTRGRLCWVIGSVEGPVVGRFVFNVEIDKQTDAGRRARLQGALEVFEELFPLPNAKRAAPPR